MSRAEAAAGGAQDVHQHAREEGGREDRGEHTDTDDHNDDDDDVLLQVEAKARLAEVRFHTRTNQQLKAQLDGIMAQKES